MFLLIHKFASSFSSLPSVFLWHRRCCVGFLGSKALSFPDAKTPPPWFPVFPSDIWSRFLHPDDTVANRSRSIACRMDRNNSLGTAASAVWKTIFRKWRTTFAPILISFSCNVVDVR